MKAVDAAATVTVVSGTNDEGGKTFDFQTSVPVAPGNRPSLRQPRWWRRAPRPDVGTLAPDEAPYHLWGTTTVKWFAGIPLHNRLPETKQRVPVAVPPCVSSPRGGGQWESRSASRLRSLCARPIRLTRRPGVVCFIHGYNPDVQFPDASKTFEESLASCKMRATPHFSSNGTRRRGSEEAKSPGNSA